jgi:hypothetical protein
MSSMFLHFSRYLEDQTFDGNSITDGWYNCFELSYFLYNLNSNYVLNYDSESNAFSSSTAINFTIEAADLLGFLDSSTAASYRPPQSTFFSSGSFQQQYDYQGTGRPTKNVQSIISLDGTIWNYSGSEFREDRFKLSFLEKENVFGSSTVASLTSTLEEVIKVNYGIRFIFQHGEFSDLDFSSSDAAWAKEIGEWKISRADEYHNSIRKQFREHDKYFQCEIPVIYQGTGDPT